MTYEVIARRWRPQTFDAVVGQTHVTTTLRNAMALGRLAHAYLFVGPRGVGKTSTARILAKAVNCLNPTDDHQPCDACESCVAIREGSALDIVEIDAASNNSVEDIRDLRDRVRFPPAVAKRKVYIIDEIHMLSTAAFNAFLKTLEEPPDHCLFLMATTEVHKIPATILSRCQRFDFRRITTRDIAQRLRQICEDPNHTVPFEDRFLLDIARAGDGSMRDAESLLDQVIACGDQAVTAEATELVLGSVSFAMQAALVEAIRAGDAPLVLHIINEVAASGKELHQLIRDLAGYARNLTVAAELGDATLVDLGDEDAATVVEQARALPTGQAVKMLDTFLDLDARFRFAASGRTALELACLKLARWGGEIDATDIIERLAVLDAKFGGEVSDSLPPTPKKQSAVSSPPGGKSKVKAKTVAAKPKADGQWNGFLAAVREQKNAVFFHTKNGRLGPADDRRVQIILPANEAYNKDYLTSPDAQTVLQSAAEQVWGGKRRVEVVLESEGSAEAEPPDPPVIDARTVAFVEAPEPEAVAQATRERHLQAEDTVLRDPNVRHILERFGGRITNIDT